jgi:hypothetical protein
MHQKMKINDFMDANLIRNVSNVETVLRRFFLVQSGNGNTGEMIN